MPSMFVCESETPWFFMSSEMPIIRKCLCMPAKAGSVSSGIRTLGGGGGEGSSARVLTRGL